MKKNKKGREKLAFIIGGNGTIGSSVVKKFLENNIKTLILDIKLNSNHKKNIFQEKFDLTKIDKIELSLKKIIKKYGCPDILVNAAYPITKKWKQISFKDLKLKELKENVNIHLNSSAWSAWIIANNMKKRKIKGSIVFINSIYGVLAQDNNAYVGTNINSNPVYSLIKGGLISFSKNLASYYGIFGIRSNSIISGGIEGKIAGTKEKQSKKFITRYKNKTILKKMATPKEISSAVIFLSSTDSSYITGTEIYVDGGYTAI